MNDNIFKQDAKSLVDMMFDAKIFKDYVTRDDMNGIEDFICYCMKTRYESHLKAEKYRVLCEARDKALNQSK